jgi:hypothetical protein
MIKNNDKVVQKHLENSQAKIDRTIKYLLANCEDRVLNTIERRMAISSLNQAIASLENAKDRLERNDWAVSA